MVKKSHRLDSIDALRGFDMLMIILADRFFYALDAGAHSSVTGFLATQFEHPEWLGFHFYDIIMPLFLFLVGVVIPFSLESRLKDDNLDRGALYEHLLRRFVILFFLGWIVQGNLLAFDLSQFKIFSNTLQAIAVGYVVSALAYIVLSKPQRFSLFAFCLLSYILLLEFVPVPGYGAGRLLPDENLALYVDHQVLGRFDDGYQYTWVLSGLGFVATTLSGLFAGEILRSNKGAIQVLKLLLTYGIILLLAGLLLNFIHPSIKKIWTSSFVLISSGISCLLLAGFYWIMDIKGWRRWAFPLKVIGANAILAYVLSHVIDFSMIADQVTFGLEHVFEGYYLAFSIFAGFCLLYLILWYLYKKDTFIKV